VDIEERAEECEVQVKIGLLTHPWVQRLAGSEHTPIKLVSDAKLCMSASNVLEMIRSRARNRTNRVPPVCPLVLHSIGPITPLATFLARCIRGRTDGKWQVPKDQDKKFILHLTEKVPSFLFVNYQLREPSLVGAV
jgi:hypothetical protein